MLEPRYEPPDKKTLTSNYNYIYKMHEIERECVLDKLLNADNYSVTAKTFS